MFINIHHYFIDSVIWRNGNPEVRQFLTSPKQPSAGSGARSDDFELEQLLAHT